MKAGGSSVDKGESLKDTALTLSAYDPDVIVIRHPQIGAPQLVAARHRGARRQRRRRQAPAPDAGAARPLHDPGGARPARGRPRRDRRRRPALARRALADPGAAPGRRAACVLVGPPPLAAARSSREVTHDIDAIARCRRRLRPAHAAASACRRARTTCRSLREYSGALGRHARAAARRARRSCTPAR